MPGMDKTVLGNEQKIIPVDPRRIVVTPQDHSPAPVIASSFMAVFLKQFEKEFT